MSSDAHQPPIDNATYNDNYIMITITIMVTLTILSEAIFLVVFLKYPDCSVYSRERPNVYSANILLELYIEL